MVRRLKDDLRKMVGGFPERLVVEVALDGLPADGAELELPRLLDEYRAPPRSSARHPRGGEATTDLGRKHPVGVAACVCSTG